MAQFVGFNRTTGEPCESGCSKACSKAECCENESAEEAADVVELQGVETVDKDIT